MNTARAQSPTTAPRPGPRDRLRRTLALALTAMVVTGCGIRLDSPAPLALVPDADEISRQATVADVVAVQEAAEEALEGVEAGSASAVSLDQVVQFAELHIEALGGVYVSGLEESVDGTTTATLAPDSGTPLDPDAANDALELDASPTEGPEAEEEPDEPATAATVVDLLAQSSARARGSLSTPVDGRLARLYASIAVSQLESARDLAGASGTEFSVPESFTTSAPASLPGNLSTADLTTTVRSEDAAGYALEVITAKLPAEARAGTAERAAVHREHAQAWAELAGFDGTPTDPRAVAYDLGSLGGDPPLSDSAAMITGASDLEATLAVTYATFTGTVEPESRAPMLDLLADAHRSARAWGAPLVAFPGMPEQL
ncbi:DUF4439 domain-containing protein [Sanguibacter suaedae]|uniref:Ferritin-like domain-containing protein n=1 Tax=Sanguibacter suaedae TaxID=2795737 RepID=A0A934MAE5_9MICO|nr:DUF4439 domain-containing protein [Sanguibacter suaedae]MBI9115540.1 ferritin-like domain-containing protein [Sanguibacter suaedae]